MHVEFFIISVISYLCGSIPFGWIFIKVFKKTDIRASGSGNIGATNAVRVGGKLIGFFTLIFDAFKGVLAILITQAISSGDLALCLSALLAVLGHMFPIWLKFKGGKGVATTIAAITYLAPLLGIAGIATWLMVFATTRISSLAALVMMLVITFAAIFTYDIYISGLLVILTILIFAKHIANIKRLLKGEELRI